MSVAETNAPPLRKNAMDRGITVSFIQNCRRLVRAEAEEHPVGPAEAGHLHQPSFSLGLGRGQQDAVRRLRAVRLRDLDEDGPEALGAAAGFDARGADGGTGVDDGKAGDVDGPCSGPLLQPAARTTATTPPSQRTRPR